MLIRMKKTAFCNIALCVILLSGCVAGAKKDTSDILSTRAVERWNLLIAGKAEKAYDYLSPGYRATKARKDYAEEMNNRPVHWKSAKFESKECQQDTCTVAVYVQFAVRIRAGAPETSSGDLVQEKWVNTDGKWYYVPTKP